MTDGYYSTLGNLGVGNADGTDNPTAFDRPVLRDTLSSTLADIAMYYFENDLAPESDGDDDSGLADFVPSFGFDDATHQHMVTFGVAFGVDGNINPDDYKDKMNLIYAADGGDDDGDAGFSIPWPTEINIRQVETIDDLYHATLNGRGQFFSADNPQQLTDSLLELTEDITAQLSGSASAVTINGNQLYEEIDEDIRLFQCSYSNENKEWTGDVKAYGFRADTGRLDKANPKWSAVAGLEAIPWNERKVATYDPGAKLGKTLDYDNLTDAQKKALGWDGVEESGADAAARNRVDYIKGKQINGFRSRSQKLGDIVHSDPVHENNVIYAGANDGMLHAFNAKEFDPKQATDPDPGQELFAYVPNLVFENLAELTKPDYNHRYFVDLTPTVKKGAGLLEGKPLRTASGDQTILVGGLGKGGKGYFALDITDPFALDTSEKVAQKVLWEFSATTDDDMGYSYSKPVVVRSYDENHPWIVIVGNGYASTKGYAVLYILDPTKKPGEGLLIKKFAMKDAKNNGLSSPTPVDVNFDGVVDYVYAGDLKGNLWKFDLTAERVDDWSVAFNKSATPRPLFRAVGPGNANQPITSKPEITFHPQKNSHGVHGYLVLFATGKFLGMDDFVDDSIQSVYGVWDYGDDEDDGESLGALNREDNTLSSLGNNITLLKQEITDFAYGLPNGDVVNVRVLSDKKVNWEVDETNDPGQNPNPHETNDNQVGWYFDLSTRERVDQDVLLREGKLIVTSWIPGENLCTPSGGDSVFMEIDAFSGGNLATVQFDLTNGGVLNQYDYIIDPRAVDPGTAAFIAPSGVLYRGKLQKPAILRINPDFRKSIDNDDNDGLDKTEGGSSGCGEEKYLSTSTGQIRIICEKAVTLGIGHWKEVGRDE
jgi:Tfp pilus tip-associated adhesin PilY1